MEFVRDDQYFEIRNVIEQDAGMYTCIAENLAGKAKQNLELQVLGKNSSFQLHRKITKFILVSPRIDNDLTTIEANWNSTINLTCSAYGNPKPTVNQNIICGIILSFNRISSRSSGSKTVIICTTVMIISPLHFLPRKMLLDWFIHALLRMKQVVPNNIIESIFSVGNKRH